MTQEDYNYNRDKRLRLIEDILTLIFQEVHLVHISDHQEASFVYDCVRAKHPNQVFRVMRIEWDDDFNFKVQECRGKILIDVYIPTSKWFQVRDLIRKRFLDAERLKTRKQHAY